MWSSLTSTQKVESPSRATPDREAVTSERINHNQFSTPTEVLDIKKPIATLAITETHPSRAADKPRRSVGNRTASKISIGGKAKTGSESKAASTVNDVNNQPLHGTRGKKRCITRKKSEQLAPKRFGDYLFYKDHDDDNEDNSNVFVQTIYS